LRNCGRFLVHGNPTISSPQSEMVGFVM
jgi:hypothetical protein